MATVESEPALAMHLEKKLGVPDGLLYRLKDEDDWSFIIKTQALLETALAYLITSTLGRGNLSEFVDRLSLQGGAGKLKIAGLLDLLDAQHLAYFEQLATLRNKVAHKIQYVSFTFDSHMAQLPDEELRIFMLTALCFPKNTKWTVPADVRERISSEGKAKRLLWLGAMDCLTVVYYKDQEAEAHKQRQAMYEAFFATPNLGLGGLGQYGMLSSFTTGGLLNPSQ